MSMLAPAARVAMKVTIAIVVFVLTCVLIFTAVMIKAGTHSVHPLQPLAWMGTFDSNSRPFDYYDDVAVQRSAPNLVKRVGSSTVNVFDLIPAGEAAYLPADDLGRPLGVRAVIDYTSMEFAADNSDDLSQVHPFGFPDGNERGCGANEEVTAKYLDGSTWRGLKWHKMFLLAPSLGGKVDPLNVTVATHPAMVGGASGELGGLAWVEQEVKDNLQAHKDTRGYKISYQVYPMYKDNEARPRFFIVDVKDNLKADPTINPSRLDATYVVYNVIPERRLDYAKGECQPD